MRSTRQKILILKESPVFSVADEGLSTRSFIEACVWRDDGKKVIISFRGCEIGEMRVGKPVANDEASLKLDESEPYGTVHYCKADRAWFIHLPDELLEGAYL